LPKKLPNFLPSAFENQNTFLVEPFEAIQKRSNFLPPAFEAVQQGRKSVGSAFEGSNPPLPINAVSLYVIWTYETFFLLGYPAPGVHGRNAPIVADKVADGILPFHFATVPYSALKPLVTQVF
jgi:hypothetical protein